MTDQARVALITGAARGIGLAVAKRFLAEGWRVALLDIDAAQLQQSCRALAAPDVTLAVTCDVADADAVHTAVAAVAIRFGRLDALVNNAGIATFKPMLDTTVEEWNRILAVNLSGPLFVMQAAAPAMRDSAAARS